MEIGRKRTGPLNAKEKIARSTTRERGADVKSFPSDLGAHAFLMNFVDYSFDGDTGSSSTTLSVAFPLPGSGIVDQAAVQYNATDTGPLGAALATVGGEAIEKFTNAGTEAGDTQNAKEVDYNELTKNILGLGGAIVRDALPAVAKNAADLSSGTAVNPHIALLFQAVGLKTFNLTWKFAPRTQDESDSLKGIIKSMQKAIHPEFVTQENNFFLKYPNQVDCYYQGSGDYLHFFKRAAVTQFQVNYQPEGGNVLFAGTGAPTFVELTMGFQEVEIWTAEDYE